MIAHAVRLSEGQPIYTPPSLDFVPFFYTPGYPALLWLLSPLTGELSFTLARLVSISATMGLMGLIYYAILKERTSERGLITTRDRLFGLLGVGLYAGLYRTCGAFYDLARPDALAALFTACVIYLGRFGSVRRGATLAALLMSFAFFTKQTAAVFYPAIGLYWLTRSRRGGLIYLSLTFALCAGGSYALNVQSDGAFWRYIFEGHQGHVFYWKNILLRYWRDLIFLAPITLLIPWLWFRHSSPYRLLPTLLFGWWLAAFAQRVLTLNYPPHMYYRELWYEGLIGGRLALVIPPLTLIGCALMLLSKRMTARAQAREVTVDRGSPPMSAYWLWIYIAGAGASALNHSTQWAYSNCFMPLSLACALAIPHMVSDLARWCGQPGRVALVGILSVQWIAWGYAPSAQLPSDADVRAHTQLSERLKQVAQGRPVLMPGAPLLPYQLGLGPVSTHQMGITDVAYRGGVQGQARVKRGASKRVNERVWEAIVTHEQARLPWVERGYYQAERFTYIGSETLRAKTGFMTRPATLWLPRHHSKRRWLEGPRSVNAHFEANRPWEALGWQASGDAFGRKPARVYTLGREGDYVAQSSAQGVGSLSAQLSAPNLAQERLAGLSLSALVYVLTPKGFKRPRLTLRLNSASGALLSQVSVRSKGPHRISLPLSTKRVTQGASLWPVTVTIEDQDPQAGLWVDDLRWQSLLGSPNPAH